MTAPAANGRETAGPPARIILFDGVCVLCTGWVRFVIERDRAAAWRFVAVQSAAGGVLARRHGVDPDNPPTTIVIAGEQAFRRSGAAIAVLETLPRWRWIAAVRIVPRFLRDWIYDRIALNRYRVFGRRASCMVPTPEVRARFIERAEDLPA